MGFLDKLFSRQTVPEDRFDAELEEELTKALPQLMGQPAEAQAHQLNPTDIANVGIIDAGEAKSEAHKGLDYEQLRYMSRVPIITSLIQTRVNQIAEFAKPCYEGDSIGYHIQLRDRSRPPTEEETTRMKDIYEFMQTCGDPRIDFEANFEGFLRMLVRDSLTFDQANFEVIRDRAGRVCGFNVVDASSIRRARLTKEEREAGQRDPDGVHYVQVLNNKVAAEFGSRDLCWGVRRPRSDVRFRGYGFPELEEAVPIITNLLNAENFNAANFTNGISVSGIVAVKTRMNPQLFRSFRREFYAMLSGSHNSKRTPLVQLDPEGNEDIKAVNLSSTNKEMEFQEWINYQVRLLCAIFQIDPAEIGFTFGQVGVSSSLNQRGPAENVLLSREKGLRPLLRAIEYWLNKYIVSQIDDRFEITFTGLDSTPVKDRLDMDAKRVRSYMTINELRQLNDLPPLPNGDVILDPSFIASGKSGGPDGEVI